MRCASESRSPDYQYLQVLKLLVTTGSLLCPRAECEWLPQHVQVISLLGAGGSRGLAGVHCVLVLSECEWLPRHVQDRAIFRVPPPSPLHLRELALFLIIYCRFPLHCVLSLIICLPLMYPAAWGKAPDCTLPRHDEFIIPVSNVSHVSKDP